MSRSAIDLKVRFCGHDILEAGRRSCLAVTEMGGAINSALNALRLPVHVCERRRERWRFKALTELAERDPHLDVEVRTGADGVTRVIARRLGVWGCDCEVHRERRARAAVGDFVGAQTLAGDGADGGDHVEASADVVPGESEAGFPGGFSGTASSDPSTAGDGAGVPRPQGPEGPTFRPVVRQRRLGRSPESANDEGKRK